MDSKCMEVRGIHCMHKAVGALLCDCKVEIKRGTLRASVVAGV